MKHDYIIFWNEMALTDYDAFLVKEDGKQFFVVYPIVYFWLVHLNRLDEIEKTNPIAFDHDFFGPYRKCIIPKGLMRFKIESSWIFDFFIPNDDLSQLNTIALFFEHYLSKRNGQNPIKRLENAIVNTSHAEANLRKKLVEFIVNKRKLNESIHLRLPFLLSYPIQNVLKKH